jgi:HK97 gp10 family phage protein
MALTIHTTGSSKSLHDALRDNLERVVAQVLARAQERAPVDTGQLRGSGLYEMQEGGAGEVAGADISAVIAFTAEHAAPVELGTSKMSAQPFLVPSVEEGKQALARAVAQAVGEAAANEVRRNR